MKNIHTTLACCIIMAGISQADTVLLDNDFGTGADIGPGFESISAGSPAGVGYPDTGIIDTGNARQSLGGLSSLTGVDITSVSGASGFRIDWIITSSTDTPYYNGLYFGVTGTAGSGWGDANVDSIGIIVDSTTRGTMVQNEHTGTTHSSQTLGVAAATSASLADGFTISLTVNNDNTWSASSTGFSDDFNTSGSLGSVTYNDVASSLIAQAALQGENQLVTVDHVTVTAIPEPATLGLFAAFGGAVLFIRRRLLI